jgi:hypothetical protein
LGAAGRPSLDSRDRRPRRRRHPDVRALRLREATVPYEYLPFTENRALDTLESAIPWLEAGYASFRGRIAVLADAQLDEFRPTHLKPRPIRWIASIMLQHALYHSGEINHIRALHQGDDF